MHSEVERYIHEKLLDLDKQKDMQDVIQKGKLSFGMDKTTYGHLPAWASLLKQKKKLMKLFWLSAFAVSFFIVLMIGDYFHKSNTSWLKACLQALAVSGIVMLFYILAAYYNLFIGVRQTERSTEAHLSRHSL